MHIEIESPQKKSYISSVEINYLEISFFRENFIYIIFKEKKEKEDFLKTLESLSKFKLNSGESYASLDDNFISQEQILENGFNLISTEKFEVDSYSIQKEEGVIKIQFYNSAGKIEFFLFEELINFLVKQIKNDFDRNN